METGLHLVLLLLVGGLALQANCSYLKYCHSGKTFSPTVRTKGSQGPLILTPYIENGETDKARDLSKVTGIGKFPSYSGYFTVDSRIGGNMFFWFFPAQQGSSSAPLLLWLQGGPGGSSLFGLFVENGPLAVDAQGKVYQRNTTWNLNYHMLFIDNPVGTGFSFVNSSAGYCADEGCVAENLYSALTQFYQVFSLYRDSPFYITGESYAGKYIPALAYKIHTANPTAKIRINLAGAALGDAFTDPGQISLGYGELLFNMGLATIPEMNHINSEAARGVELIKEGKYVDAFNVFDILLNGDIYPYPTYFHNITGVTNYDNMLETNSPVEFSYYTSYLNDSAVRAAIHVGDIPFVDGSTTVEMALLADIMYPQTENFTVLIENYKVLAYNGQLDLIVGAPLSERFLWNLTWTGQSAYQQAQKMVWKVHENDTEVAGYVRKCGKFQQVVVRGAGHIVPADQPERALNMIRNFIEG